MFRGLQVVVSGIALAAFTLAGAAVASAQEPAAAPEKPVLTLEGDANIMIVLIKPDKTADFEAVIAKYKEALAKNDKAARKEQLAGFKVYKSPTAMGGNTAYVFSVDRSSASAATPGWCRYRQGKWRTPPACYCSS